MKKTLLIMVMALAVLLTQCRKPEVKFPSPVAPEGTTVSMTVTAGPGSKTDITTAGGITWSVGDKLYVGYDSKYVGYLTITSGVGTPTGTFNGDVTLTDITEDTPQTFHFFYLGSGDYTSLAKGSSTFVDVDFSSQEIYADVNNKLVNASAQHVGYGTASGTVKDGIVTGINVTLVSKVALARFSFKKGGADYTGALTLSGTNIYNSMTVGFGGEFNGKTKGTISLTGSHSERYVMLVPTGATTAQTLKFTGSAEDGTGDVSGLESNKFYGKTDAIAVTLTGPYLPGDFTVSSGVTVKFSRGNLYAKKTGTEWEWGFYEHQYDMNSLNIQCIGGSRTATSADAEIDLFTWGYGTWSTDPVGKTYQTDAFTDWDVATGLPDAGEGKRWRTLTYDEWKYLLNTLNASSGARTDANRFAKAKVNGVCGLLIFPDRYTLPSGYTTEGGGTGMAKVNKTLESDAPWPSDDIPADTWTSMEAAGVVFLPAAGSRKGAAVGDVGSRGNCWSSSPNNAGDAYCMYFRLGSVGFSYLARGEGRSVRLVRSAS